VRALPIGGTTNESQ